MEFKRSRRIPELDGIRGMAIALVVSWHYLFSRIVIHSPFWHLLQVTGSLSWTGVDLFFVLSGFLIGGILLDSRDSPNYFRTFYIRRFFRIVPLYFVLIGVAVAVEQLAKHGMLPIFVRPHVIYSVPLKWCILYLQNFWMAYHSSWGWETQAVTWSLAIEEQFYLTLPFAIRFTPRRFHASIVIGGIIIAPILRTILFFFVPRHPMSAFFLMPCRMDSLLFGVLAAMALRNDEWKVRIIESRKLLYAGLVALAVGMGLLTKYSHDPFSRGITIFGFTWVAAFYSLVLVTAVTQTNSLISCAFRWKWLRELGMIAYGVYLFHFPVLIATYALFWHSWIPFLSRRLYLLTNIGALVAVICLCSLSWRYFEKPLVDFAHR